MTPGATFDVVATVTVGPDEVVVDLTGTSPQSGGAINSSFSQTLSGVIYALRCAVDPRIPMNEGCFSVVRAVLPRGRSSTPTRRRPAAGGW